MADKTVILNELFLSSRRMRFLHLKSPEEIILGSKLYGSYLPLFLGADVLSNCSISVPNLPRTHAKYAKKGLATKINFPSSFRINGIQGTSKGVWFYSIQGVFRVAFEIYSRAEQLEVLQRLEALWTSRFADPELLTNDINPSRLKFSEDNEGSVNTVMNASMEVGSQTVEVSKDTSQAPDTHHPQGYQTSCIHLISDLEDFINTSSDEEDSRFSEFDNVITTLQTILNCYKTTSVTNDKPSKLDYRERILYSVCYWVGKEFRRYKEEILHHVTEFKKRHIATIDNLPSSENVIKELFPQCMIVLLKTWMEVETPVQESKTQIWLPFPLMQLILEFANQTLVSGVSHVLYSRLIRSDSV